MTIFKEWLEENKDYMDTYNYPDAMENAWNGALRKAIEIVSREANLPHECPNFDKIIDKLKEMITDLGKPL